MVSVELLFRVQVLLDVIVHALFPIGVGDFYDTIYKTKRKYIHLVFNHQKSVDQWRRFNAGVFLDVAEVFVGYTVSVCVLFIVDGCQLNTGPGPGPGTRRGQSFFFLKKKKDCCFWVTVGVMVRLGLELMSTLTLTLIVTLKQHSLKKDRPRPRVLLTRTLDSFFKPSRLLPHVSGYF